MERQIATTQDQSARLLRCGVSADTADMSWYIESGEINIEKLRLDTELIGCSYDDPKRHYEYIPAWSLSALLAKVLPHNISVDKYKYKGATEYEVGCYFTGHRDKIAFNAPDLIECAVLMIEWLTANGYKLNEQ